MGHITSKSYQNLQKRLDMASQGAPKSESLYKILEILFTPKEADITSKLPINYFTTAEASKILKIPFDQTKIELNNLAKKGILIDFENKNEQLYFLAPTMAGFFEFALMRTDGKFNTTILSELFYQYINTEEDFIRQLFILDPPIDRTFPYEESIPDKSEVFDYEKASHVIDTASCITVGTCFCRHKMEHIAKACNAPQDVCLSFNKVAESLSKHGIAKKISKAKAKQILYKCKKLGLVHIGDNQQNDINWICNCCSCCCEAIHAVKKLGNYQDISSNYYANENLINCINCTLCQKKCPTDAILADYSIDKEKCIGCGVCTYLCPKGCISLERKDKTNFVPIDTFDRMILAAIEKGKIHNYLCDNFSLLSHALLRKFLGVFMSVPLSKRILANKKIKSFFLERIIHSSHYESHKKISEK